MSKSSSRVGLWNFGGLGVWNLVRRVWRGYGEHQIAARAAQFAFHAMLALAPTLILVIAVVSRFRLRGLAKWLKSALGTALPESSYDVLTVQLQDLSQNSSSSMILASIGVLLFAGWRLFLGLGQGLNAVNGIRREASLLRNGVVSFVLTLGIVPVMLVGLALSLAGSLLTRMLFKALELPLPQRYLIHGFRWVIVVACLLLATSALYRLLPAAKIRWQWISPGSLFAVVGWLIASWGFQVYVANFGRYNETYGTLGGVIVLLLWLYLVGMFLLLGGLLNGVIYQAVEAASGSKQDS